MGAGAGPHSLATSLLGHFTHRQTSQDFVAWRNCGRDHRAGSKDGQQLTQIREEERDDCAGSVIAK